MLSITMTQAKANTVSASATYLEAYSLANKLLHDQLLSWSELDAAKEALAVAEKALAAAKAAALATAATAQEVDEKLSEAQSQLSATSDALMAAGRLERRLAMEANHCPRAKFAALCDEVLEMNTCVSVESLGDKWEGTTTANGFLVNGILYRSPGALTKAHASRITENHPKSTLPGSGWVHIFVESGRHQGKNIEQAFKDHFAE
jgi:hypothetical protein